MIDLQLLKQGTPKSVRFIPDEPPYLFSGTVNWRLSVRPQAWRPPTDIFETEEKFVVRVEIAGMKDSQFSITVNNNTLGIQGVREDIHERRAFHQMEIHYGEFSIEVEFPIQVDVERVEAEYSDGFLRVTLPKVLPKNVKVE
jgi:HSP20 family protein